MEKEQFNVQNDNFQGFIADDTSRSPRTMNIFLIF